MQGTAPTAAISKVCGVPLHFHPPGAIVIFVIDGILAGKQSAPAGILLAFCSGVQSLNVHPLCGPAMTFNGGDSIKDC